MRKKRQIRQSLVWFLLAIFIGMGGLMISSQFGNPWLRFAIVLLSVAVPLFTGGIFLARYASEGVDRFVLVAGVLMLMIGAAVSLHDTSGGDEQWIPTDPVVWLGIFSLLLGLFVVLFSVVRTGKAIDEIEERFRHVADHITEGFVLSSPDGRIVLVNQHFLEMIGSSESEVVGEQASELVQKWKAHLMAPHLDLRAKGLASEYEINWNVRGEERRLWVSGTPIFDRKGRHMGTLATMRDVTERNRMAERLEQYAKGLQELVEERAQALRQSEEQLRGLLMQMNEGFVTVDSAYRIRFINNHMCQLLCAGAEKVKGREIFDFVDPPSRIRLLDRFKASEYPSENVVRPEIIFMSAEGAPVASVVAVSPVKDAADDVCYSMVVTDITQLKEMQRQLEQRARELEAANEELRMHGRARDGFLSNVSHELKTPLSTINGYIEMLSSGQLGQMEAPQLNALLIMARNARRLGGLINEMIEFSRMEIRGVQLHVTLSNAVALVRESAASITPQAMAKDVSVSAFVADDFPPVWYDRTKIGQVLGILLSNAVKFTPGGGMIQLRVTHAATHDLHIDVIDTGIGIDPAHHARVFEKFFQVDASMTRRYEGAGIGLSIAKSIVEAHGGTLELDSALGRGTRFTVKLPNAVFDANVPQADGDIIKGMRFLLVSDSESFRKTVHHALTACGCTIEEAANGYECLRLAEETEPDAIIFDELLQDKTGAVIIGNIRANLAIGATPILIIAPQGATQPKEIAESTPGVHVTQKPFSAQELVDKLILLCCPEAKPILSRPDTEVQLPKTVVMDGDADLLEWLETGLRNRRIACYSTSELERAVALAKANMPDVVFLDADAPPFSLGRKIELFRSEQDLKSVPIFLLAGAWPAGTAMPDGVEGVLAKPFAIEQMARIVEDARSA